MSNNWRSEEQQLKSRKEAKKDESGETPCGVLTVADVIIQTRLATIRNAKDEKW